MKAGALLFLAVVPALCSCSTNRVESVNTVLKTTELPELADPYEFSLVDIQGESENGVTGRFRFRHNSTTPIRLWGFGFKDAQGNWSESGDVFVPRFEKFKRMDAGEWADLPAGYCGTGAEEFEIEGGRDYLIPVPMYWYVKDGTQGIVELTGTTIRIQSQPFETSGMRTPVTAPRLGKLLGSPAAWK